MKSNKVKVNGFNLISVIIIIFISAIVSCVTTGVIVTNNYKSKSGISYEKLSNDENLNEFVNVYSSIMSDYYENIDTKQMIDSAISGMLNYLGDSYTTYLNTDQSESLSEKLNGTYKGIGVTIENQTIKNVTKNSPAEIAGLKAGDKFKSINNKDVTNMSSLGIADLIKNNDEQNSVNVVIDRDGTDMTFIINLSTLILPSINYNMIENTKIGYIAISVFSNTLFEQMQEALNDLQNQGMEKLIIDVRDNTGGYLNSAEKVSSLFLEKGKTIYTLENKDSNKTYKDETNEKTNYEIVILINKKSASASEILAAALIDSYGAKTVGEVSYGKGKVQQTISLSDGSMAKYTSARWLRPNGECIDGIGIIPDYSVELDITKDENNNIVSIIDTQYNKAIEILNEG